MHFLVHPSPNLRDESIDMKDMLDMLELAFLKATAKLLQ